ncbi:T9SS type A sorting domain-containing protein [Fibrella forsythiae]|uniref:T9SS type A sorting domain-containing protein n=1 Tax=Fibrella forsythiae TaxID=2817061 RepID=A0ABS3JLZ2_9BACT|nr:T9SS type A sorting domain-containing protein [Fibrella forsythiae]MBO0950219.1 T9SS type A sorting domain-containing protein [Fibrella forsythiae]
MMHRYALRLLVVLLLATGSLMAQKRTAPPRLKTLTTYENFAMRNRIVKNDSIICYASKENVFSRIGPPAGFNDSRARKAATAKFVVKYIGYPDSARAAFQRAVDIWSTLLVSPVTINITAVWQPLATGVLGSARPADYVGGPDGSQRATTYYPMALAEKVARRNINHPDSADIIASFSSTNNWYLGLDGKPTAGKYDLVTIVLHELGHGLGFTGGIRADATSRAAGVQYSTVFDAYVENRLGTKILNDAIAGSSSALYTQLTGQNLYINGPTLVRKTGDRAKLYAPTAYSPGSTLYHLDETTYRASTANSLMTPFIGAAEVAQDPGPIVLSFFEDLEWKTTSLLHTPITDTESTSAVTFTARVVSDTTLGADPPKLFYRTGFPTQTDNSYKQVNMVRQGTTDTYSYTLPASEMPGRTVYYLQTQDGTGKTYTNPGKDNGGTVQYYYSFTIGPDRVAPTIVHAPEQTVILEAKVDSLLIVAKVSDNRRLINAARTKQGIDTVYVDYQINGVAKQALPMFLLDPSRYNVPDSTWATVIPIATRSLKAGSVISYRIIARDVSAARNQAISPVTGFYSVSVVAPQTTVRTQYTNDFNVAATAAADFAGNGFSIQQPASFTSASINSDHPYKNGLNAFYESNYTYTLLAPIRVKTNPDSARIQFDEIALVEPNDAGAAFNGEGFYDYVTVEGSKDNGLNWFTLLDGYNVNAYPEWTATWNSSTSTGSAGEPNSTAVGTQSLLKTRTIGLQANGTFKANDVILIRFRLFADQLVHGWGWQIDNLKIQVPPPPVVLATEPLPLASFSVYPNPASGSVRVMAELSQTATEGTMTLSGPTGQTLRQLPVTVRNGKQISEQLDVSQLPTGMYFLQLNAGDAKQVKKIMVTR